MNKTIINGVRALTIGAIITLGFSAATASAAGLAADQALVRYPDLDLSKMAGAAALYSRISHAARVVCQAFDSRQPDMTAKYDACLQQAVAKAVADVNSPLVSQYHELHTKGDRAGLVRLARVN